MKSLADRLSSVTVVSEQVKRTVRLIWQHPSNRDKRLRRVAYAFIFQMWARTTRRPLKIAVGRHSRMFAYLHFSAASEVVYANPPSTELLVWQRYLNPGDWFLDVGASVGVYTIFAIEQGADVVAFEPNSDAARIFRENMRLNRYEPDFHEVAVADREGSMTMTFDLDVANHLMFQADERTSDVRIVQSTTLDQVIGEREVAGVKIDTEGSERLVLEGAARALADRRIKLLQLEWNYASMKVLGETREPVAAALASAGYRLMRPNAEGELVRPVRNLRFGKDVFAVLD